MSLPRMDSAIKTAQLAMEAGHIAAREKRHRDAATLFQEATEQYEKMNDDECTLRAKSHLARQLALTVGATSQALQTAEDCQRQCKVKASTGIFLGSVYNILGLAYMDCKAYPSATTVFLLALQYYKDSNWLMEATINQNIGCAYSARTDHENARRFHEIAANIFSKHGNDMKASQGFMYVAWCYANLNRHNMAREAYEKSLEAALRCDGGAAEWPILQGLAASYSAEGQPEKAAQYYRKAFEACLSSRNGESVSEHVKERLFNNLCNAVYVYPNPTSDVNGSAKAGDKVSDECKTDVATVSRHNNQHPQEIAADQDKTASVPDASSSDAESRDSEDGSSSEEEDAHEVAHNLSKYVKEEGRSPQNAYAPFERTERGVQSPLPQAESGELTSSIINPTHRGQNDGDSSSSSSDSDSIKERTNNGSFIELSEKSTMKRPSSSPQMSETYEKPGSSGLTNYFRSQSRQSSNGLDHTYQTIDHFNTNAPVQGSTNARVPSDRTDSELDDSTDGASNDVPDGTRLPPPSVNGSTAVTPAKDEIRLPSNGSGEKGARSCTLL